MTTKYGAGAYTGKNPIGPSEGYVSPLGISENDAQYHPESVADLTKALTELPGSGRLIWVPKGVTITVPNSAYGKTIKSGFILAGPGKVKWNYYGPTRGYMIPLFNVQDEAVISGIDLEGGGGYGHYGQGAGPCAIRASGRKRVIIENIDLTKFRGGGVWFGDGDASITRWDDDTQRNIVRHCKITHIQQYGFGYGCGQQGSYQSFLLEACILGWNRHSTMTSGGTTSSYEVRFCIFEDSVYANSDSGPASIQSHQVDAHGGGWKRQSYKCGKYLYVHHNDFSLNTQFHNKPNIMIRGIMAGEAIIEWNWTRKYSKGSPPDESLSNMFVQLAEEEGEPWTGPSKKLSLANVVCRNNWYGKEAPPDEDPTPPVSANASIKVTALEAPEVVVGEVYAVTATVTNEGDGAGSADIEIGWITASGSKRALRTIPVTLEPGESKTVEHQAKSSAMGDWTFYAGSLTTILKVVEKPPAVPILELGPVSVGVADGKVDIVATVTNTGNAEGSVVVKLGGDVSAGKTVTVAPGASQEVAFGIMVELSDAD